MMGSAPLDVRAEQIVTLVARRTGGGKRCAELGTACAQLRMAGGAVSLSAGEVS